MTTGFSRESELPTDVGQGSSDASIGQLIGEVAGDVSKLFRQEVQLAKAEIGLGNIEAARNALDELKGLGALGGRSH